MQLVLEIWKYMDRFHKAGSCHSSCSVYCPAKRMEKLGADAVSGAEGMGAGGHIGKLTTMTLVSSSG